MPKIDYDELTKPLRLDFVPDEYVAKVFKTGKESFPGFQDWMTEPMNLSGQVQSYYDKLSEKPSLGGAASMFSQYTLPGGAVGAGAIALSDTSKAGGLGTVGGSLAKGFEKWYHGTPNKFTEFKVGKLKKTNQIPFGAHFTQDRSIAEGFSSGITKGKRVGIHGEVKEVNLKIQNPFDVSKQGIYREGSKEYEILNEIAETSGYKNAARRYDPEIGGFVGNRIENTIKAINPDEVFGNSKLSAIKSIFKKNGFDLAVKYKMKGTRDPMGGGVPEWTDAISILDRNLILDETTDFLTSRSKKTDK